jgi:trimeric autotransporter adhesin
LQLIDIILLSIGIALVLLVKPITAIMDNFTSKKSIAFIFLIIFCLGLNQYASAQTTYTWNQTGTASWATASNWTPSRTSPANNDILQFNNGATTTATAVPAQTIGKLLVSGNTTVNLQPSNPNRVLSIDGGSAALSVASGSALNLNSSTAFTITVNSGSTGSITGNMTFTNAAHTLTAADASGITFSSPAVFSQGTGCTGNVFGNGTSNSIVFGTGTTFAQSAGANPFQKTQPASVVVFQTGNLFRLLQSAAPSFSGRTYANFEYNPTTGSQSPTGSAAFVCDNLTVTTGTLNIGMTGTPGHSIKGNISVASGATLTFNPASAGTMNFNGTTAQTITNAGTLTMSSANQSFVIANTASPIPSVTFNNSQTIAGNMTVNAGSILATGGTLTLNGTTNTINGSFQINQGGFGAGGTWTYGSGSTLIYNYTQTGTYGPVDAAHKYWPTTNAPTNVTLQMQNTNAINAGNLQLGGARTIAGTLSTNNPNGRTMTLDLNGNAFQAANLTIGTTAPLTLAGTTTTTITGNVSIGANFTINGDLKVGGNWTKSASGITFTRNSKAVFFTGSGTTQTITVTGGGTETFDYLLIDKATAGTLSLAAGTNLAIAATTGNTFEIKTSASNLNLNGQTISFSSTGGNIFANGVAATINGASGSKIAVSNGTKTFTATSGSWSLGTDVALETNSGVNFGSGITTLNGTFKILSGGFASGNTAPIYASGSTLEISNGGSYSLYDNAGSNESAAWFRNVTSTGSAQQGVPWNFVVSNGSSVNWNSTGGDAFARYINGDLTINSGSFTMSNTASGDLYVRGNFTNNGTFNANGRTVTLNGNAQSILGATTTFQDLVLATSMSTKTFGVGTAISGDLSINTGVNADLGTFESTSATLTLGGSAQGTGASYGGTNSPAGNINPTFFAANTGYLNVGACNAYSLTSAANTTVCVGNAATIAVTSSGAGLPVGTYMVFYTLTGANTGSGSSSMTVTVAGAGSFVTSALSNSGLTTITIDYLTNGCVSRITSGNTTTINVNPASTAAVISGSASICPGNSTNLQVAITGGTPPYTVVYTTGSISGYTSGSNISVSPTTTTNYTITSVTDFNGCAGTGNSGTATVTLTTTTSTDGGASWDNGTPTATSAIIFDGGSGTINSNISGCSLTLTNNAAVLVNPGVDVTLSGALTVDFGSFFTLDNNANLLQGGTTNANSGDIIVKRNSSPLKRLDYTLWSSPVVGQGLYAFSPFTFGNRFYVYRTNTNLYNNSDIGFSLTGLNPDGVNGADSNNVQFAPAKGYLIRMPWDHPTAPTIWNGTFTGLPNNGDITFTMTNGGVGQRFNLVGNPYPSPISMAQFVSDNSSNITGTLYFWRETNGNTANNAYCSWAGGTFTTNGQAQVVNPNGIIRTGQGFFVEASGAATTLDFKNGQRSSDNTNQFFRANNNNTVNDVVETNRFWLNLTNAAGAFSQMAAGYMTNATDAVDLYDGRNINTGSVLLNSILNNTDYTIQGKALPFNVADVIPLSCKITDAGQYAIAIDHVDGLFTDGSQAIYLKDNLTATEHNLQTGAYTFSSAPGTFNNRFEIIFQSQLGVSNPAFSANNVIIYAQGNDFVVNSGNIIMESIKVFDIRGRLLQERKGINASQININGGIANEMLLVQITSEDGVTVTKKAIR